MRVVLAPVLEVCLHLLRVDGVEDTVKQRNDVLLELRLLKLLVPCPRDSGQLRDLVDTEERHLGWLSVNTVKKGYVVFQFLFMFMVLYVKVRASNRLCQCSF